MRTLITVALLLFVQSPPLGPVDGLDLPAMDLERVQLGELAPDFRLEDETGQVHQLSQYRGHKKVVLIFFRGYW